ncbi:unnamed protein product [Candida verbasci]|uniref:Uncharacterized protein n=1 Tax=Candida verbasci TaxID=1227364 RepID=A0A9W4TXW0_9ASCO|nr:unnamed protein product [Candida verbasci]
MIDYSTTSTTTTTTSSELKSNNNIKSTTEALVSLAAPGDSLIINDIVKINKAHSNHAKRATKLGSASATWSKIKSATTTNTEKEDIDDQHPSYLIENGPSGEISILYNNNILEVWKFKPDLDLLNLMYQLKLNLDIEIKSFKLKSINNQTYLFVVGNDQLQSLKITEGSTNPISKVQLHFSDNYTLKISNNFIIVAGSTGYISIFKVNSQGEISQPSKSTNIKKQTSIATAELGLSEDDLCIKTNLNDDNVPIYDIVDNWLIYSPTKTEYTQLKKTKNQQKSNPELDPIITNYNDDTPTSNQSIYTPIKLNSKTPLFNKLLSTFSKSALDGLYKFSKLSSKKFNEYMNNELELNSLGSSIKKSTLEFLKPSDNQILIIVDLSNDKILARLKFPDGVSKCSLSPFDSKLLIVDKRGDAIYLYDLFKLPLEISLTNKYIRGKTSAVVSDLTWSYNGNVSFGVITKLSGSIHWYDLNLEKSWILSNFKGLKFFNLSNQLSVLDENNNLKLFNENGSSDYEFNLPKSPVSTFKNRPEKEVKMEEIKKVMSPLSQAEIETCSPFLNLINNKRIEFATYDPELNNFDDEFGNEINGLIKYKFNNTTKVKPNEDLDFSIGELFINQDSE